MSEKLAPRYAIVNTCDAPCKRMVCERVNGKYYYMLRESDPALKACDGMQPVLPTAIEEFGFSVTEAEHQVHFVKTRESSATYEDGTNRKWQDAYRLDFILPRVKLGKRRAGGMSETKAELRAIDFLYKANLDIEEPSSVCGALLVLIENLRARVEALEAK